MKKLLYPILAVSIILSACKKEEEDPTNTGNNNSTFLTWIKTLQGSEARDVQQTTDGGYIITGKNHIRTNGDGIYLIKTDDNGNVTSKFQ